RGLRRLGNDEASRRFEEADGAFCGYRRLPERPSDDQPKATTKIGLSGERLRPAAADRDPARQAQTSGGLAKIGAPALVGVHEDRVHFVPEHGQDETRDTGSGPQVEESRRRRTEEFREGDAVVEVAPDRLRAEVSVPAGLLEDLQECLLVG